MTRAIHNGGKADGKQWQELRDDRGVLCARVDVVAFVLEIEKRGLVVLFDLRPLIEVVRRLEEGGKDVG